MPTLVLVFNDTAALPKHDETVGGEPVTVWDDGHSISLEVPLGDDMSFGVKEQAHEMFDFGTVKDIFGKTLKLHVIFGVGNMQTADTVSFLESFFTAKHKWAFCGSFTDTSNFGYVCKCNTSPDVNLSVPYDLQNGYDFESEKVF